MSVARPFSSIMGDMDVDQALARLGISRTQLQEQTSRMKQFLSSDATFAPMPGSRVFAQHASQPSLPTFPSAGAASGAALARSRSLDSSAGFASASAGPSNNAPQETPSRTRKADASETFDERDSKRRRGEKTARKDGAVRAKNASGGSDPARRLYTTEPIPPYPAGVPAAQQDVFYSSHTSPVASSSRTPSVDRTRPPAPNPQLSVADVRVAGVSPPSSSSHQPPGSGASSSATSSAQGAHTPQSQLLNGASLLLRYPLPPGFAWQQFEPKMPYHLPPGPRSEEKPSLPYAALIGQALLAAYFRRLPLHDITTYITLVHPYYKRADTTWQNSLRHNLSTNDSFQRVDRHPDDHLTHGPCWMITPGHEKFFVGGMYCKPRNSPTKPKRDVVPDPVVQVQVKQEPVPIQISGPSFPPHPSAAKYYRERAPSTAAPPPPPAPVFAAPTPAYVAPAPTFNANYYRETTWKGSGAIPVYPPPGHALVTAYMPASLPRPAFRSAPPVIASSSPAPTPGAHQREYTLDPVQRLRALLDADSDSDETPSPEKPAHARSISAGSSASLMDRKLLGAAPTSPITVSLMERTLERKALLMAQRGNPVEEEDEPELTPSPVAAVVALPPEVDEPTQELPEDFVIDPEIVTGEPIADDARAQHAHDEAEARPVQVDEEPEAYDPALSLDEAFETQQSAAQADGEDEADEQDDSGYRSSNSSPGVPLALLLTKRKNEKQRQQDLSAAFTFSMPPQSPMSDLRSTARNNIKKKAKRKGTKGGAKTKKKRVAAAPVEAEEQQQPAAEEPEDEAQELIVPQRFATPPPLPQSSPTFPRSPFRTPLTSRNTGGEFAAGSPARRDMYSTPKRPFMYSPLKTPAPTEDPFNAAAELERTLEELPQCSPMRDRPWGGHALSPGYPYGDFY